MTEFAAVINPIDSLSVLFEDASELALRLSASPIPALLIAKLFPHFLLYIDFWYLL